MHRQLKRSTDAGQETWRDAGRRLYKDGDMYEGSSTGQSRWIPVSSHDSTVRNTSELDHKPEWHSIYIDMPPGWNLNPPTNALSLLISDTQLFWVRHSYQNVNLVVKVWFHPRSKNYQSWNGMLLSNWYIVCLTKPTTNDFKERIQFDRMTDRNYYWIITVF